MTKELVTIEFRYNDKPKGERDGGSETKTITIGVYDTFDEAIIEGNKAIEIFEKHFALNPNYNKKERFSKNGGCFGYPNRLIAPLGYLHNVPFDFYARIETLKYNDVEQTIIEVLEAGKRYREFKKKQREEDED